mgnify:CR=1 FL=1
MVVVAECALLLLLLLLLLYLARTPRWHKCHTRGTTYEVLVPKNRRGKRQPGRVPVRVVPCSGVQLALSLLYCHPASACMRARCRRRKPLGGH